MAKYTDNAESGDYRPSPATPTSKQTGYLENLSLLTVRGPVQKSLLLAQRSVELGDNARFMSCASSTLLPESRSPLDTVPQPEPWAGAHGGCNLKLVFPWEPML
jgi:hypothetical protein